MSSLIPLLLLPALAAAEQPQEFAYGIPLAVDGRQAFYQVQVPRAVYEGVLRADLGDLRIFNADGEVVPHAMRPQVATKTAPPPLRVALFPIRTDTPAGIDGLDLRIEKSGDRTVVNLSRDGQPATGTKLVGYIADASGLQAPVRALTLELPASSDNVVSRLTVAASDDLRQWSVLAANASIVRLEASGERLEQLRIEFSAREARYLRLTSSGRGPIPELAGLAVESGESVVDAPREWKEASGVAVKGAPGELEVDLGGQFPVDRLRLKLPQVNTVVALELLARAQPADPWRRVTSATVYRLNREGEEVRSSDIAIGVTSDRYWLVKIDPRGGGIGSGELVLAAGWEPHRLVFAARGRPPFQLAYGSRNMQPAAYAIKTLVPGYRDEPTSDSKPSAPAATPQLAEIGVAQLAAPQALGGEAAKREPMDWKRWTLWGSLVLGVTVLGLMALRLGRQISKGTESASAGGSVPP